LDLPLGTVYRVMTVATMTNIIPACGLFTVSIQPCRTLGSVPLVPVSVCYFFCITATHFLSDCRNSNHCLIIIIVIIIITLSSSSHICSKSSKKWKLKTVWAGQQGSKWSIDSCLKIKIKILNVCTAHTMISMTTTVIVY